MQVQSYRWKAFPTSVVGLLTLVWMLGSSSWSWAWQPQVVRGTCKTSGKSCDSTIGNAGGQGACCDPLSRDVATCAQNNPCTGGQVYRWADSKYIQGLQWYFNPNNMPNQSGYAGLTETNLLDAFKAAWDAWSKPNCTSFAHKYAGKTTNFLSYQDQQNTLILVSPQQWAQMGAGSSTLAFTRPVPARDGLLIDADIVFNPTPGGRPWKIGTNAQRFDQDIIHVAAHEIGHAIGFGHSTQQEFLMYFASRPGPFPGLHQDDINGVCYTYPKRNCTSDADCGSCLSCQSQQCLPKNIAVAPKACQSCTSPTDCGGGDNICVRLEEGNRCAQLCNNDGCCPKGYRCADFGLQKACIPDAGQCPPIACTSNANCGPGESCQSGSCKPQPVARDPKTCTACSSDSECGGSNKCGGFTDGKGRCLQPCAADNFCPTGFVCSSTLGGRFCTPPDGFCPCSADTQCLQGEACKGSVCRPAQCRYGCACAENSHCDTGYQCFQTEGGGVCVKPCGSSASFPDGAPGSRCTSNGTCTGGAQCFQIGGGQTICMQPCSSSSPCNNGGQCYRLGGSSFCLCQGSNECRSGQACNKSILGQFGGGACATAGSSTQCDTNFECREVAEGVSICMPASNGGPGAKCGGTAGGCKTGLQCVQTAQGSQTGNCIEDCTADGKCDEGGECVLQATGGTKFCGCSNQSQCRTGQKCDMILGSAGVCTTEDSSICNSNGTCEPARGENCNNCSSDCGCKSGESCQAGICRGAACGNNTCERDLGEDCGTCPNDCKCDPGKICQDSRCVANNACGNNTCERDLGEDCGTCPNDCKCDAGKVCQDSRCVNPPATCGNGTCDRDKGENCTTCIQDCPCPSGQNCQNNACVPSSNNNNNTNTNTNTNANTNTNKSKDGGDSSDEDLPVPKACGCDTDANLPFSLLWIGLILLGIGRIFRQTPDWQ